MPDSLVESVTRYTNAQRGESPFATAIAGFTILRSNNEKHPSHTILKPALCVVVQGAKWTSVGTRRFQYKAGQALVISIEIPSVSRVTEARPGRPYLAVVIEFDLGIMREVMEELDTPAVADGKAVHGIFVTNFDGLPTARCAPYACLTSLRPSRRSTPPSCARFAIGSWRARTVAKLLS